MKIKTFFAILFLQPTFQLCQETERAYPFSPWHLFGLPGPKILRICDESKAQQATIITDWQKKIENANNFVAKAFLENYLELLKRAAKIEKSKAPTIDNIKEKLTFEAYELAKGGYTKEQLAKLLAAAKKFNLSENITLPLGALAQTLSIEKTKELENQEREVINSLKLPSEITEDALKTQLNIATQKIINSFFYSYSSEIIRDSILETLIKLIEAFAKQDAIDEAKKLHEETTNLINIEWNNFPVNLNLQKSLATLVSEFEREPAFEPATQAELTAQELEAQADQLEGRPIESANLYGQAIKKLDPSSPQSAKRIINLYVKSIEKFSEQESRQKALIAYKRLLDANKMEAQAKVAEKPEISKTITNEKVALEKELEKLPQEAQKKGAQVFEIYNKAHQNEFNTAKTLADTLQTSPPQPTKEKPDIAQDYLKSIDLLRPFVPSSAAQIIDLYIQLINQYLKDKNQKNAIKFTKIAQDEVKNLSLLAENYLDFEQAKIKLDKQIEKIKIISLAPGFLYVPGILTQKGWLVENQTKSLYQIKVLEQGSSPEKEIAIEKSLKIKDIEKEKKEIIEWQKSDSGCHALKNAIFMLNALTAKRFSTRKFQLENLSKIGPFENILTKWTQYFAYKLVTNEKLKQLIKSKESKLISLLINLDKFITVIENLQSPNLESIKEKLQEQPNAIHAFIINHNNRWITLVLNKYLVGETISRTQYLIMDSENKLGTINSQAVSGVIEVLEGK